MKLNLGGGEGWQREGWDNLDKCNGYDLSDCFLGPFRNESVDLIYTSHCIEHLRQFHVVRLLKDCHRVLVPGGTIRVVVPDIDIISDLYCKPGGREFLETHNPRYYTLPAAKALPLREHIEELAGWHWFDSASMHGEHKSIFSKSILRLMLVMTGFSAVRDVSFSVGDKEMAAFDNPDTKAISLFMEARK